MYFRPFILSKSVLYMETLKSLLFQNNIIIESVDSISRDDPDICIYNTLQNAQYLRAGERSRFLAFIFMILSRIPIYQAQKCS